VAPAISARKPSCAHSPDGYTLLPTDTTGLINATLYDKLSFVFLRDIAPVASIVRLPLVMVVHPSVPAKTAPDFIAYAKANPGKINVASPGIGTAPHVAGELFRTSMFKSASDVRLGGPYSGSARSIGMTRPFFS
jgi:tripartite-type tricarboxylate transporter receptor subunit TctC